MSNQIKGLVYNILGGIVSSIIVLHLDKQGLTSYGYVAFALYVFALAAILCYQIRLVDGNVNPTAGNQPYPWMEAGDLVDDNVNPTPENPPYPSIDNEKIDDILSYPAMCIREGGMKLIGGITPPHPPQTHSVILIRSYALTNRGVEKSIT